MSFYRTIERGIWGDEIIAGCSRDARLLFIYLCCNQHDDLSGAYRLTPTTVEEDIGLGADDFAAALAELEARVSYDRAVSVVWVHNMLRKQAGTKAGKIGAKHVEHARRQLDVLPRTALKAEMVAYYRRRFGIEIGYSEDGIGCPSRAGASVSARLGSAFLGSVSEGERDGEAPTPPETGPRATRPWPEVDGEPTGSESVTRALLTEALSLTPPGADELRPANRRHVAALERLLADGEPPEEVKAILHFAADRVREGVVESKWWGPRMFEAGPWQRWRDDYAKQREDRGERERRIRERQEELKRAEEQPA